MERAKIREYPERVTDNSKVIRVSKEIFKMIYAISREEGVPMSIVTNELLSDALENYLA